MWGCHPRIECVAGAVTLALQKGPPARQGKRSFWGLVGLNYF